MLRLPWAVSALLLLAQLGSAALTDGACATASESLLERLQRLPHAELLLLGELLGPPSSGGSTRAASAAALIHRLAHAQGDEKLLLEQALDELGAPSRLDKLADGQSASLASSPRPAGGEPHAFVYLLQPGAGARLEGVSSAFLCFLLEGLATGPAASADAGVLTCHLFPRFCESWFFYRPGTRIEVYISEGEWNQGTVVSSTVHQVLGGVLTGELEVRIDDAPHDELMSLRMPGNIFRHLTDDRGPLVRFWEWSEVDQEHFVASELAQTGADFVMNPVRLGRAMLPPGTRSQAWGGGPLIYLTVLSNPLDAVVARFSASRHHVFRSLSDFVEGGVCPFEVGDERCWDADFYTQALASPGLCQGAAGGAAREGREVCSEEAEEEAVKRVESMQVVLMADWLHLSAPVICQALGTAGGAWCDPAASAQLAARVQEESAGWCGVDGLLALDGEGPGGQRAPLLQALIERNRRDLRLFAAARARARSLLVAAGVTPPPDVGGAANSANWGRSRGACGGGAAAAHAGGQGMGGGATRTLQGARVHMPVWMQCRLSSQAAGGRSGAVRASQTAAAGVWGSGGSSRPQGLTAGLTPSPPWMRGQGAQGDDAGDGTAVEGGQSVGREPRASDSCSQHEEELYAYRTFFWEQTGGSFLELGAVDGETYSNTVGILERRLRWKGVLVEASPASFNLIPHKRPNQIAVHAAICGEAQDVHWANADDPRFAYTSVVSGIAEFLAPEHKLRFYSHATEQLQDKADQPWAHVLSSLPVVRCLPLTAILEALGAFHINFFILDVEGAEMSILTSLDWERFSFDVLCIENQYSEAANDAIKLLLAQRGYTFWALVPEGDGKNNWFVRDGFEPRQRPLQPAAAS